MNTYQLLHGLLRRVMKPKYELIITDNVTMDHVMSFQNTKDGVLIVYPAVSRNGSLTYSIIFIDKTKGFVHCCNTRAETMNCQTFLFLRDLGTEKGPFNFIQHRIGCSREDLLMTLYLAELLTYNYAVVTVMEKTPTDKELIQKYGSLVSSYLREHNS